MRCSSATMSTDTATTRDLNKAQIYAWRKGIKTLYYIRIRQQALEGTESSSRRLKLSPTLSVTSVRER